MTFATKKYTRPALRAAVRSVNVNNFADFNTFAKALSPRAGRKSAQVAVLRNVIKSQKVSLSTVFNGNTSNYQTKAFLLALLK